MKKERRKGILQGAAIALISVFLIGTAFAASGAVNISVTYSDVKIVVDGKTITPKDADGNVVEPFIYNGTTYLPVRAVGDAFGKTVEWDAGTKTVKLTTPTGVSGGDFTLGVGTYTVGTDIPSGKYNVTAISGFGNFMGSVASCPFGSLNEILAYSMDGYSNTYSNLTLANGDIFYITSSLQLRFVKQ